MPPLVTLSALAFRLPERQSASGARAMPGSPNPLDALMARLKQGDRSAFTGVFEQTHGPISRLCRSMLHSDADAADATQEAMCKILERVSDYDPARPALPWALAIAAWECRTLARKRTRRRETDDPVAERGGDHPEEQLVQQDLVAAAVAALGELSEADRETLI